MYRKMADVYDVMYHFKDYAREADYISRIVRSRAPRATTLLETACGTGSFLELLRREFSVTGLDLSDEMLEKASRRVPDVPLHAGNMLNFDLARQFDVVCCLFRSIAHCRTPENLNAAILSMARHVRPGGLLLIEPFFTPQAFWDDNVVLNEYKSDALKLAWMYVGKRTGTEVSQDIHCLVGTKEEVRHFTETVHLGLFTAEQFAAGFDQAGLALEYEPTGPSGIGLYIGTKPGADGP
jgi:ubiquinone/menaquinone biosynthesis C-methylase UbiE